ncbi:HEAT repeat protein-like protein [Zopfia rhizophila CBS 207.26]|uniref:HEAT repeat protein-like protein n=1 Tax=Zopfia rhizophila CBS 207.26 TaxID=1314779 RepID=A0A6A6EJF5_9PEZI|nr:HEAT repeat protein-like protein [Zopfia rhizophila CBS 207.26]
MVDCLLSAGIPVPERTLRGLQKDISRLIPKFELDEQIYGVKQLHDVVDPLLETANVVELAASHRAAACNALCAIIENCQTSEINYVRTAVLEDGIWFRLFNIFLERSDNAKPKSMRQVFLVLTGALSRDQTPRTIHIRDRVTTTFLEIICQRQDRLKVKPALQGLAYFLAKNLISIPHLVGLHTSLSDHSVRPSTSLESVQLLLSAFLGWVVHHDTAPSAGHLIKNFLNQLRHPLLELEAPPGFGVVSPLWVEPIVKILRLSPDRIQEFKANVFPHCFLPNINEYLQFLSYLHFSRHIYITDPLPAQICVYNEYASELNPFEEFKILLATIQTGKELGIVKDVDYRDHSAIEIHGNAICLPDNMFGRWLSRPEPEVRLAGLFLSVYSTAVTKPITTGVFQSLKRNLVHLHGDTDANFRGEILSHTQRLFDRLRASTATLVKLRVNNGTGSRIAIPPRRMNERRARGHSNLSQGSLWNHLEFITWYLHFLEGELRPTASYQRHITALKSFYIVMRSGLDPGVPHHSLCKQAQGELHWAHELQIFNSRLMRLLLDLLLDPFDDVRSAAASLLALGLESKSPDAKRALLLTYPCFLERAEAAMLITGRADQADGVARAYSLLFSQCAEDSLNLPGIGTSMVIFVRLVDQLEETVAAARDNLSVAVNGRPVHGIFAALRYIMDQHSFYTDMIDSSSEDIHHWKELHDRIYTCFASLWSCVRHVLCNDAPEGYVPEALEEEPSINTKEILSYSWRGLKESSILLQTIISKAPIGTSCSSTISPENFEVLGRLCFTQLSDLRHRGAFSTVAQTFSAFCRRCSSADNERLRSLPEKWYQETLLCIQDKATSITRRSAGIPALMAGIIGAELQPGGHLFPRAICDLFAEVSIDAENSNIEESRLPQVHALNCIKEIFTTSRLSTVSEAYIGDGLDLAARTLNSKIWPIRNCSLMLFKALIERLLGSSEAQDWKEQEQAKTSRFSYNNYPNLVGILSYLLDPQNRTESLVTTIADATSALDLHGAEGVFPALQILQQSPPHESHRAPIFQSVIRLTGSPHWHLRDMAARTVVALQHQNEYLDTITTLLSSINGLHNSQHGLLLCVKYVLKKYLQMQNFISGGSDIILNILLEKSTDIYTNNTCPFTRSVILDLANLCGHSILRSHTVSDSTLQSWAKLTASITIDHASSQNRTTGDVLLQRSIWQFFFIDHAICRRGELRALRLQDILVDLSRTNPHTCCAMLDLLHDIIIHAQPTSVSFPKPQLLSFIHKLALLAEDEEVKSKAQFLLAEYFQNEQHRSNLFQLLQESDITRTIDDMEHQCLHNSPSNMQSAIRLLGSFLDFAFATYPLQKASILPRMARYIRLLRFTIDENNPFDSRLAASQSLSCLHHILTAKLDSKPINSILLALSFLLFDLLHDDDDEIRDLAAPIATRLILAQSPPSSNTNIENAVPILTSQRLASFIARTFSSSTDLCKESLCRLLGAPSPSSLFARPFRDILAEARQEDTSLFIRESQNLFRDPTLTSLLYTRILTSLSLTAIPLPLVQSLQNWTFDALETLAEVSKVEEDGALGWSSKDEVFELGMRFLGCAEVVLGWEGKGLVDERGKKVVEGWKVRRALRDFVDVGAKNGIHGIWVERVEMVLAKSLVDVVREMYEKMVDIQKGLGVESRVGVWQRD